MSQDPNELQHHDDALRYEIGGAFTKDGSMKPVTHNGLCEAIKNFISEPAPCNENHVNETKTLQIDSPAMIGMDFAREPSKAVLVEHQPGGKMIVHDVEHLSEVDIKRLASQSFDEAVKAGQQVADAFEQVGEAAKMLTAPLENGVNVSVSKHAHGRMFPLPKKVWNQKKARRKQQTQSRKANRR